MGVSLLIGRDMSTLVIVIPLSLSWSCGLSSCLQPCQPLWAIGSQVLGEGTSSGVCTHRLRQLLWERGSGVCASVSPCVVFGLTAALKQEQFAYKWPLDSCRQGLRRMNVTRAFQSYLLHLPMGQIYTHLSYPKHAVSYYDV